MITFSPIQKSIQKTLKKKMRMLDKQPQLPIGEPTSDKQQNYMYSRTCFIRMTSLVTEREKPVVIMGGELVKHNSEGSLKPQHGMGVYGKRSGAGSTLSSITMENESKRPLAGIKEVNVEFEGAGLQIGSRRKTTINWMCWTWEEIERLQPFFLTHARSVLVEFGWSFQGPDSPMLIDIIKENGEINKDRIKGVNEQKPLQELLPQHILQQNGHYDAVLGIVSNFEFTVNESGGFDCTTELVSSGVNIIERIDSTDSVDGHINELPILEPKGPHGHLWWYEKETDFTQDSEDLNPYYSFRAYMATLEGHLNLNAQDSKGSIAYQLGDDTPFCTWGWFEDNVLSRFAGQINLKNETVLGEFRSIENVYDKETGEIKEQQPIMIRVDKNILPVDYSPEGWFWINPSSVKEDEKFWKNKIKENNSILIPNTLVTQRADRAARNNEYKGWIDEKNEPEKLKNGIQSYRLGKHKLTFGPPYVQQGYQETGRWEGPKRDYDKNKQTDPIGLDEVWRDTFMGHGHNHGTGRDKWNYEGASFRAFKTADGEKGVLRNIYFGHEFLSKCFEKGTILEGINEVWNKFSTAYGGIYDFGVDFDDKEGRIVIRDKGFATKRVKNVLENKSTRENYNLEGCFVFPVWQKDSIVITQNLTANLPDRMKMAAMYGTNEVNRTGRMMKGYTDWGAYQLNQKINEHFEGNDDTRTKFLDSLIGNMELPFKRNQKQNLDYSFGNASAYDEKRLQWRIGPTPTTTEVYEDKSNLNTDTGRIKTNSDNDHWGVGINEYITTELKKHYSERVRESTGYEDDKALKKAGLASDPPDDENAKTTLEKMKDRRKLFDDTVRNNANNLPALYDIINVDNQGRVFRDSSQIDPHDGARYHTYPIMKPEHKQIMQLQLNGPTGMLQNSDPLVKIELELEIDGTGGIFPGNSFHSAYLPESYMNKVCFQAMGASHRISPEGWSTTIKGQMKVSAYRKPPPTATETPPEERTEEQKEEVEEIVQKSRTKAQLMEELGLPTPQAAKGPPPDEPYGPPPPPPKKKKAEKFKEKVKISREMEETEEGSGLYKINSGNVYNQSDINEGSVIFVGSITGDNKTYDAGSGLVTTPTGQININDIQGTAGGTYDATTGNTFQWRVADPGEDVWWRQKW